MRDKEIETAEAEMKAKLHEGRFDYVKYDEQAQASSDQAKQLMVDVDHFIELNLKSPRAKALALTKLEECFMWIGKAIRDDQKDRSK